MIMTIGGDAHKRTHTFVVADPIGRNVAEHTFAATTECHIDAQRVVRVPTQLMAGVRKSARTPGNPTRSTRSWSPEPRCVSRICRSHS